MGNENGTTEPSYPYKKTGFYHHHHHQKASEIGGIYGSTMAVSGKLFFTATQWQELERQTMIFKYMMASIPVPPQLLLSLSTQSNRASMGLKFSNGSVPEPWRCRRTDGKKWRCSKDVAPDQKYCEHHSHKSRPRSRKPVEIQPHNSKDSHVNNIKNYKNPRCGDLFMKNGTNLVSESKRDNLYLNSIGTGSAASDAAAGGGERRQHFIESWSRIGNGDDCSLTLSMQSGGNEMKFEEDESFQMAVGMLDGGRGGCGDVFRPHHHHHHPWLNQPSWAGSTPGGPLGEALCLGIASTTSTTPHEPSSHGSCEGGLI